MTYEQLLSELKNKSFKPIYFLHGDEPYYIDLLTEYVTSNDYLPPEVPALPAFNLQRAISHVIRDMGKDYWTGTVFSTNRRVWEHDEKFKEYLRVVRSMAIDMETATLFTVGFTNEIPTGALLLVSDQPMIQAGVKTRKSDRMVTEQFASMHLQLGIESLHEIIENKASVKHLKFNWE